MYLMIIIAMHMQSSNFPSRVESSNQDIFSSTKYLDPGLKWSYMLYDSDISSLISIKELMLLSLIITNLVA